MTSPVRFQEVSFLREDDLRKVEEILGVNERAHETVATKYALPDHRGAEFLEEIRQPPPVEAEVPEPPAPQIRYVERLVSKPGHFPPQFVKVPAR